MGPTSSERLTLIRVGFNTRALSILALALLVGLTIRPTKCDEEGLRFSEALQPTVLSIDGINIDQDLLEETIDDSLRSKDEQDKSARVNSNEKHPFDKACPYGYFVCDNGECIAPKWRCDGHPDCDDYSDELNCTALDMPHGLISQSNTTQKLPNVNMSHLDTLPVQVYGLDFNSTVEPLMIFSTGQSIRGLWMRSRIYFDIVTRKASRPFGEAASGQPSITEAFSLFFGILGLDPGRTGLVSGSTEAGGSSAAASRPDQETSGKPDNTIVGLDMNPANKEVFWVELGKDPGVYSAVIEDEQLEIGHHKRQFHGHKKIVEYGLLSPEDIALDTIGRNAYITDAGLPAVVVCSYVHVHCRMLVQTRIHKPRAIIADSASGWVIYTDWGDRPGIFLVSMDGKRRETLIETDVVWPNGLTQDHASNSLFWADARLNKIERVDLKTRKRTELIKEVGTNPFSVSVFENRVYWSDWSGNEIKTCDKDTGNNTRNVLHANDIYGIHIYHPDLHSTSDQTNPCWAKHCSHLCLLSPPPEATFGQRRQAPVGASCACPDSMTLGVNDKATCFEVHLSFLLVNVKNYIAQVFPERIGQRVVEEIVYSKDHAIQDMAADWVHYKLFFFDASKRQLLSADFSGRQTTVQKFASIGAKVTRGLTYDLQSDNLFWLDPELGTLTLCSVRGAKFQKILRRNLERATSMVLDTKNRLFYIALTGSRPRIIRTDIMANESSDVVLMDGSDLGLPIALHLDEQQQRLYWADAKYGKIESVELDVKSRDLGHKPRTRVKHRGRMGTILSFSVFRDYFVWVSQDSDYMFKARRDDPHSRPVPLRLPTSVSRDQLSTDYKRMITLNPMTESLSSPCLKRACSHACIVDRDREAKCICPDGFKLQASNRSNCMDASKLDPSAGDERAPATLLRPSVISQLAASSEKRPMSAHEIDDLTNTREGSSKDFVVMQHLPPMSAPVSNMKHNEQPHVDMDHSMTRISSDSAQRPGSPFGAHLDPHQQQHQQSAPDAEQTSPAPGAASEASTAEHPVRGNKLVWLITFLLVLVAGALITIVTLMILNKQGRLPRQMSQLTVSFISPSSSAGSLARDSGIDKDKTMLLLDTDS